MPSGFEILNLQPWVLIHPLTKQRITLHHSFTVERKNPLSETKSAMSRAAVQQGSACCELLAVQERSNERRKLLFLTKTTGRSLFAYRALMALIGLGHHSLSPLE